MEHKATIARIEAPREDIRILTLRPATPFSWQAGQYINISFGALPARAYSIANAPNGNPEIHIKRGKGTVSAYVMDTLKKGDPVSFTAPEGNSVYSDAIDSPVLAIAGGLGIAPIKAIAEEALRRGFTHPFILYWSAASACEHYIDTYFKALAAQHKNFSFIPVEGSLAPALIEQALTGDPACWHIFISGPPAMIGTMIACVREKGADPAKIRYDRHPEAAGTES